MVAMCGDVGSSVSLDRLGLPIEGSSLISGPFRELWHYRRILSNVNSCLDLEEIKEKGGGHLCGLEAHLVKGP